MQTMNKRRWRWTAIVALLGLLLGIRALQSLALPSSAPQGMAKVALVRSGSDVNAAVRDAVSKTGGFGGIIEPGDVVVVKVNLVMDAPAESGMVTGPAVARAVVQLAREAGAGQVFIAEGTAQYREGDANRDRDCTWCAYRAAGYDTDGDRFDDLTGAPLVDLNDAGGINVYDPAKVTQVVVPTGLMRKEYWLPNTVLNADVLISVPVLKNHYLAGVTLGMKNLIGLLPGDLYHGPGNIYGKHSLSHSPIELDQHIVDLNLARRPDFVVVDGQRGMIDGPIGSQIIDPPMSLVLAGSDTVAVDTVGTLVMGYDPRAIPYLRIAAQNGLGTTDTGHIRVVGAPLAEARRDFPAPYADSPAQRADAQPPAVALDALTEGPWAGVVNITVDGSDNDGLARVELYMDGKRLGESQAVPYQYSLDTAQHVPGEHALSAVAYDHSLNMTVDSQAVIFAAPEPEATETPVVLPTATLSPTPPPTATALPSPTSWPTGTHALPTAPPLPTSAATATAAVIPTSTPVPSTLTPSPDIASATTPTPTAIEQAQASDQQPESEVVESDAETEKGLPSWILYALIAILWLAAAALSVIVLRLRSSRQSRSR